MYCNSLSEGASGDERGRGFEVASPELHRMTKVTLAVCMKPGHICDRANAA